MLIDGTPVNCCQFRALRMRRAEEMLRLQALKLWFSLLNYGFVKHLTRLVYQCSTRLQKFTNQLQVEDP